MSLGMLAGEFIVSVPGPEWATTFWQFVVVAVGVFLGLILALRADRRHGRLRVGGLIAALGIGVALPAAMWIGTNGRTSGGMVGRWQVICEQPFVASKRGGSTWADGIGWNDFAERCRERGAAKAHTAEALAALALLLVAGGLLASRRASEPEQFAPAPARAAVP